MYFDFDFERDKKFFEQSPAVQKMKEKMSTFDSPGRDQKIVDVSIQLWAESIIKHNLDINMTRVDHIDLISEQNSKEVKKVLGKIMFKSKDRINDKDRVIIRTQKWCNNYLQLNTIMFYEEKIDICNDLKNEFLKFKNLTPDVTKKLLHN